MMSVNLVSQFEYSCKFISSVAVNNLFVFTTDCGLLIFEIQPDLFRSTTDYKVFRTSLPYFQDKPFEDKNFRYISYERPMTCQGNNITIYPNNKNWNIIYMGNYSNILFLGKNDNKWMQKLSDIPKKWFLIVSKKPSFIIDEQKLNFLKTENRILSYCREKEITLQIKNFIFTHILTQENETEIYGTVCCHVNNMLTFWSTTSEKSLFLAEYEFHNTSIKHLKWFCITNELSWLIVCLTNGQIYVHEIYNYPHVQNTFMLWSGEDFACVNNICIESISNDQCLIFFTKMSFIFVILYSLTEKQILSLKKEMIPKTAFIPGLTFLSEKKLLILVTDFGKFFCMYLSITNSEITYTLKAVNTSFNEQVQNFTCSSVIFSKNKCTCVLTFECNIAKYSKNDGHINNKLLFCMIPESLVEIEKTILSVNDCDYNDVIDCIETLRINRMYVKSNVLYILDHKSLANCSIQYLKLNYWKIAFKKEKSEHDEKNLQVLQVLLHVRHLTSRLFNKKNKISNAERYYCRIMLSYYMNKLPMEYKQLKTDAANLISSFIGAKHTYSCSTCEKVILSFTDFRIFICELEHKELRCPVTLEPLDIPCLVCSMCLTMANVKAKNESCVWCFGKYVPNELLL